MKTLPAWGSFLILGSIVFVALLIANWLPLTDGWTIIAAGCIGGSLGLVADQWAKRRGSDSG